MGLYNDRRRIIFAIIHQIKKEVPELSDENFGNLIIIPEVSEPNTANINRILYAIRQYNIPTPSIIILPAYTPVSHETFIRQEHKPRFEVLCIERDSNPMSGIWRGERIGGAVFDALMKDRQFAENVLDSQITGFNPDNQAYSEGSEFYVFSIDLECRYVRNGGQ